jgi:DNA repair photolyase
MIISASRRTDIPNYYSEWFFNRLKEGYVLVRNPMNMSQVSKISLSPDVVDGVVFWTKNPVPMLERLKELRRYTYYFQFTLNPYGKDVEPNVPSKNDVIIPSFRKLSRKIGKERVVWRYDPILFNERYTMEYHVKYFKALAAKLCAYTEKCTVSFLDFYRKTERNTKHLKLIDPPLEQKIELMQKFSEIAREFGLSLDTCAENIDLDRFGIKRASCVDKERFERLLGAKLIVEKDKNQRPECGCVTSIDIGAYNTCKNGCYYCYANYSMRTVMVNYHNHNPLSPLIIGEPGENEIITVCEGKSCRDCQVNLFD